MAEQRPLFLDAGAFKQMPDTDSLPAAIGPWAENFSELGEVPAYASNSLKGLRVNAGETAIEAFTVPTGLISGGTARQILEKIDGTDFNVQWTYPIVRVSTKVANHTLELIDSFSLVRMNVAGANDLTVPLNATVPYNIGTMIYLKTVGAGATTIVATGGVTINADSLVMSSQHDACLLIKVGTDEWDMVDLFKAGAGGGGGGSSTFVGLTDTPSSFTGKSKKILRVNIDENALEYVNAPTGPVIENVVPFFTESHLTSTSSFATKGNVYQAVEDIVITEINFRTNVSAAMEVVAGIMSGSGASDTISNVSTETVSSVTTGDTGLTNNTKLSSPLAVASGEYFFIGVTRTDGTGTSNVGLYYHGDGASQDAFLNDSVFINNNRWSDNDIVDTDSPASVFADRWSATFTYEKNNDNFLALTDTPGTYTGQAGKFVKVNTGETALEFVPAENPISASFDRLSKQRQTETLSASATHSITLPIGTVAVHVRGQLTTSAAATLTIDSGTELFSGSVEEGGTSGTFSAAQRIHNHFVAATTFEIDGHIGSPRDSTVKTTSNFASIEGNSIRRTIAVSDSNADSITLDLAVDVGTISGELELDLFVEQETVVPATNVTLAMKKVGRYTGTAQSTLDIPFLLNADSYLISGKIAVSNDATNLEARMTTDSFSTVESAASDYSHVDWRANDVNAASSSGSTADDSLIMANNIGNASNEYWSGELTVYRPEDATVETAMRSTAHRRNNSANTIAGFFTGSRLAAEANNGLRIFPTAGTIDYDVTVYAMVEEVEAIAGTGTPDGIGGVFKGAKVSLSVNDTGWAPTTGTFKEYDGWDQADYDNGGWWDAGTPAELVVPTGVSKVMATLNLSLASLSTTRIYGGAIRLNGAEVASQMSWVDFTISRISLHVDLEVSPGDIITGWIYSEDDPSIDVYDKSSLSVIAVDGDVLPTSGVMAPHNVQVFPASGTYTPTPGTRFSKVTCIGAGGGSGAVNQTGSGDAAAGGGGGGAAAQSWIADPTAQTVTIGSGGTAGLTSDGDNVAAGTGGDTSFGSLVIAKGGSGGGTRNTSLNRAAQGGDGGLASTSTGDITLDGNPGGPGILGDVSDLYNAGGAGGTAALLGAGAGRSAAYAVAGNAGAANSGGGASGANQSGTGSQAGAAGGSGLVIVEEYAGAQTYPNIKTEAGTTFNVGLGHLNNLTKTSNASAVTATIPAGVGKPGDMATFKQGAAGALTFVAGGGVTLQQSPNITLTTAGQHAVMSLICEEADVWTITGDST